MSFGVFHVNSCQRLLRHRTENISFYPKRKQLLKVEHFSKERTQQEIVHYILMTATNINIFMTKARIIQKRVHTPTVQVLAKHLIKPRSKGLCSIRRQKSHITRFFCDQYIFFRSNPPEGKAILLMCNIVTGEYLCRSVSDFNKVVMQFY